MCPSQKVIKTNINIDFVWLFFRNGCDSRLQITSLGAKFLERRFIKVGGISSLKGAGQAPGHCPYKKSRSGLETMTARNLYRRTG
jgi:hypothetical protein